MVTLCNHLDNMELAANICNPEVESRISDYLYALRLNMMQRAVEKAIKQEFGTTLPGLAEEVGKKLPINHTTLYTK